MLSFSRWEVLPSDTFAGIIDILETRAKEGSASSVFPPLRLVCREWKGLVDGAVTRLSPRRCLSDGKHNGVGNYSSLTHLDLSHCSGAVSRPMLESLRCLCNLRELSLRGCSELGDSCVFLLSALPRLRTLSLAGCPLLTDSSLDALAQPTDSCQPSLPQLTSLDISGCNGFSSSGLGGFLRSSGQSLCSLSLEDCDSGDPYRVVVDNSTLSSVAALPHLTDLNIAGVSSFNSVGVACLTSLSILDSLDLGGCSQLGDSALVHLSELTTLRRLDLSVTAVTDSCLLKLLPILMHLHSLKLSACDALTGYSIQRLGDASPQLEELSLRSNVSVTDNSTKGLAAMTRLRTLDLSYCVALSDEGLAFVSRLQKLTSLSLSGCLWVNLGCVSTPSPVTRLSALTHLDLSGSGVRDEGLSQLTSLPSLSEVDLSSCHEVSSNGLAKFLLASGSRIIYRCLHCDHFFDTSTDSYLLPVQAVARHQTPLHTPPSPTTSVLPSQCHKCEVVMRIAGSQAVHG